MAKTPASQAGAESASVIVALTGEAADTAALEHLLTRLPLGSGAAIVVILQNREALDRERLAAILREGGRELTAIVDGEPVQGGRIYLPEASVLVSLEAGHFRTAASDQPAGGRGTIDSFLVSLARHADGHGIAVVLGDTGEDGTLGFKAVKEAGGLTLAEETEGTRAGDLVVGNMPAALADAILPVEALAARLAAYIRQAARQEVGSEADAAALAGTAGVLRDRTGHDFHGYKPGTFLRRVQRRMQVVQRSEIGAYVEYLRAQPEEVQQLFNDLLIGVTQFFRDGREFAVLERAVIPQLFAGKGRDDHVRVWVVGCSTGEEAYSLGILLREHMATLEQAPQVQIFATDLDGRALAAARAARYADTVARDVGPERLARWFVREGNTYCVVKELREMCIFSQHSIIKDPPFSRLDLISCRNLLIYLDTELQSRVIPVFHFALRPGGALFLGTSENVSRHANLFAPVENRSRIFRRLETHDRVLPDFPFTTVSRPGSAGAPAAERPRHVEASLARRAERLAERYAPAHVIVDAACTVLHFSGRTGRYIDPAGGTATLNLLQLVHPDLRLDLRTALERAMTNRCAVRTEGVRMGVNGHRLVVEIVVEPLPEEGNTPASYFVLFKDGSTVREAEAESGGSPSGQRAYTQGLEAELRTTKDRLQATIEELESTNEELKASNEEYQSLNEELQSANEELETSKEELQSVNEELTTVNGELGHRVQELGRTNSDLKNFLESTQIATIFLDNDLRVTNHTPAVTEIFHLVESDVGRPIAHIKSRIAYDELQDDARRVLRTLGPVEREITGSTTGTRYMVRVLPYRSVDNFIAGVVVTFVDITARKLAEERQQASERRLRALVEGMPQLVWRAADGGRWLWTSPQWCAYTGLTEAESREHGWLKALHPDDRTSVLARWREAESAGLFAIESRICQSETGHYRWFKMRATPVRDERGTIAEWLGTSTDIDDLRQLQEQQEVMVNELQHRTRNLITVVRSIAQQTMTSSATLDEFRLRFNDRLGALSRVQSLLSRAEEEPITLSALIRTELDALAATGMQERVSIEGPDVSLRKASVQTLALALHELATNARKYGALAVADGQLRVRWRTYAEETGERRLALEWTELGIATSASPGGEVQSGYGRELIEKALPYALDARTHYELRAGTLHCIIDLPLERRRRGAIEEL
ncbi:CheR family methyltransferase [Methylobacterium gregans]|uniref:Blue-light-activated histidine kinase n=1 Tax=Methylobacterium gregans TaxID=374424 RepID=A0AA37MAQ7_9HYPH|nr:CheR family methyltransferase [Methylobacterium gregans]MDQ0523246.1 two-component system CheB/CheR fusion protein [Methylobacterium gregans]GJD78812.1 Protein-glutamate methylesterase/protein-glutamine glutaminase [Methylobacterium gregans]GLS53535.1 methyltransferase [Methylobacterium gregans]